MLVEGDTQRPLHRAAVIGLDTYQSSILFLIVFFVIVHSVPIDSVLYRPSIRGLIDFGEILSITRFLFPFIHRFT